MHLNQHHSRRSFLTRSAQLGLAGVAAPLVDTLGWIGEAAAASASDYKALVCVFLYGGNDYANTLAPYDDTSYAAYLKARPSVALTREALAPMLLRPDQALPGGRHYALVPAMAPLLPLFDQGKMAMLLNVGTLMEPTTKAQYLAKTVRVPPKIVQSQRPAELLPGVPSRGCRDRLGRADRRSGRGG